MLAFNKPHFSTTNETTSSHAVTASTFNLSKHTHGRYPAELLSKLPSPSPPMYSIHQPCHHFQVYVGSRQNSADVD